VRVHSVPLILVVDDDPAICEFVQLALEDAGYEVMVAIDGVDALAAARNREPALILLDMRMPSMNGWEFAEAYRQERGPHAPILIMTAGGDAPASDIGAAGWLGKPFDLDHLITSVRRILDSPARSPK
jgi:DNA-binding response OmpR family regulator